MSDAVTLGRVMALLSFCALLLPSMPTHAKSQWYAQRNFQHPKWIGRGGAGFMVGGGEVESKINGITIQIPWEEGSERMTDVQAMGIYGAGVYFLTDHLAAEISLSFFGSKGYEFTATNTVTNEMVNDKGKIKYIPLGLAALYYPAPYGEFQPYVGAGYTYIFTASTFNLIDMTTGGGPMVQLGMDWWLDHNLAFNTNIRYSWIDMTVDYTKAYNLGATIEEEGSFNPFQLNVGLSYAF